MRRFIESFTILTVAAGLHSVALGNGTKPISPLDWDPLVRLGAGPPSSILSAPRPDDLAKNLVGELKYITLEEMRAAKLENASLSKKPWSGWFFPLIEGGLVLRYADPSFPKVGSWTPIKEYLLKTLGQGPVDRLSPMEKYDLLLGDRNFSLSRRMIQLASHHAVNDAIPGWIGYCTGWASASVMLPRPVRSVTVLSRDGKTRIPFRPSDIKALGTLLWANGSYPTRLTGQLCQESPIRRDPKNDRPLNSACNDTNPATWHLAVVNQIGAKDRTILMDADPSIQIWNHPVYSYSYQYFNPLTGLPASFEAAKVPIEDLKEDKFAGLRAPGTRFIIGIEMSAFFIYEKRPDTLATDSPQTDEIRNPIYKYDLELDQEGRILGGEWWSRLHPDVLWEVIPGSTAVTFGDSVLQTDVSVWTQSVPLPEAWVEGATLAGKYLQPLGKIVNQLFRWAS